ncbi:M48 family metalloprotease [Haloarcula litorea]|uniref:M48 family metalloprotease n=1 Tax=Haloarcula litorea TaxID=3032579 RepID=UPI0023E87584|nr:M48 family metalloprotease [Halomicroarcula sp. GDY20]
MGTFTRRIALTLALLLALDLLVVAAAASLLTPWLGPVRDAVAAVLPVGPTAAWWLAVVAPATLAFAWAQARFTRANTLARVDAAPVSPATYPDLHARVERRCQQADLAVPTVAVTDSDVPNSFTVGTPGSATLVVSEGLLDELSGAELDAVLAHELMHVKNRDAAVMTLAGFLPALANGEYDPLPASPRRRLLAGAVAVGVGYLLAASVIDAPLGSPAFTVAFLALVALTVLLGGVVLGVLTAPVVALARSLSRSREFVADRSAARLTGDPAALVGALETLDGDATPTPETDAREAAAGVRGLCFLPHGFDRGEDRDPYRLDPRSHPPTEERVERLAALAGDL